MNRSIDQMKDEGEAEFLNSEDVQGSVEKLNEHEESKSPIAGSPRQYKAGMYIYFTSLQAEAAMKLMPASFTLIEKSKLKKEGVLAPQRAAFTPKKQKRKDTV